MTPVGSRGFRSGVGAAMIMPVTLAVITSTFPDEGTQTGQATPPLGRQALIKIGSPGIPLGPDRVRMG